MNTQTIYTGADEHRVNDEAVAALALCHGIYQRGGELVRVVEHLDDGKLTPKVEPIPTPSLRETLSRLCDFRNATNVRVHPPDWCVSAVANRGNWGGVRRLVSLVEYPVLLKSGAVLQSPGYDPDSFLLYAPSGQFQTVPLSPTAEEVTAARDRLLDLVCDFPFAEPVHRSAWLAGCLSLFARPGYDGATPFILIDGNVRGSGKSLLCDAAALIATGRRAPRTTQVADENEERKRITAVARAGDALILVDNIARPFGNGSFDSAITSTTWKERLLGQSEIQAFPLLTVWWGTGNNVQFRSGADTARRTLHIRLLSPDENPEARTNFKHPHLVQHILSQRGQLAADCLTLLRAWSVARKSGVDLGLKNWGSFEGWSAVVRGAIVYAGLPDPIEAHEEMNKMADTTSNALEDLVEGWYEMCHLQHADEGATVREALDWLAEDLEYKARTPGASLRFGQLWAALPELCKNLKGRNLPDAHELGLVLRSYRSRAKKGLKLEINGRQRNGGVLWVAQKC